MTRNIILGAGFSAAITNFFFKKKSKVIGLHNFDINNNNLFFRRSFYLMKNLYDFYYFELILDEKL